MSTPTTAEKLREQHGSFIALLVAADNVCDKAVIAGNSYLYHFADGSALRLSSQHVEVVLPTIPLQPEPGYRPDPGEIATYSPDLSGGMIQCSSGRWYPAAEVRAKDEREQARTQALVTALEKILNEPSHEGSLYMMKLNAKQAIELYTGEPYPARSA
jgi:hypothetical protein